jgi:hypothetical protein
VARGTTTTPTPEQVDQGLRLLINARHSRDLNLLDKQVLVELCNRKLEVQGVNYEAASASSLVAHLSNWVRTF